MSSQKPSSAQSTSNHSQFPFVDSSAWFEPVMQGPAKLYATMWKEALRIAAHTLHDQADYVQQLSECPDPAAALRCQGEFMQRTWARSVDEGSKLLKSVQTSISSSSA